MSAAAEKLLRLLDFQTAGAVLLGYEEYQRQRQELAEELVAELQRRAVEP